MSLIPTPTPQDLANKVRVDGVLGVAHAAHHTAIIMTEANRQFWAQPDDQLLLALNADVSAMLSTLNANSALAAAINQALDLVASEDFPHRAPTTPGREFIFDGTEFTLVPVMPPDVPPLILE